MNGFCIGVIKRETTVTTKPLNSCFFLYYFDTVVITAAFLWLKDSSPLVVNVKGQTLESIHAGKGHLKVSSAE